jgi:HAD superfamily hydrolase (TIGR01549 family)
MPLKAVLFDWDGTLTGPTNGLWLDANNALIEQHGISPMSMDEFAKLGFGTDVRRMLEHLGLSPALGTQIERERNQMYNLLLQKHSAWETGAPELLQAIRDAGTPIGVITHARHTNIQAQQERLQYQGLVDVFVAKDDMELPDGSKHYKPDPFGAQLAAERLDVSLEDCCYIGDLHIDMHMARAAGIPGILIDGPLTNDEARKAAIRIYASLVECRERMEEWMQ